MRKGYTKKDAYNLELELGKTLDYLGRVNARKAAAKQGFGGLDGQAEVVDWTVARPLPIIPMSNEFKAALRTAIFSPEDLGEINEYPDFSNSLREQIQRYFLFCNITADSDNIFLTSSVFEVIDKILSSKLFRKNDSKTVHNKVLIATPTFGYYEKQCSNRGVSAHHVKATSENGWRITPEQLDEKLKKNPNIKLFIFNNPVNPTGISYTKEEVEALADILVKYPDVNIISDEIFKDINLSGKASYSMGACPQIQDRVVTLNGLGKSLGLTGIRCSAAHIPHKIQKLLSANLSCSVTAHTQYIAEQALRSRLENQQSLDNNTEICLKRFQYINLLMERSNIFLNQLHGTDNVKYIKPFIDLKMIDSTTVYLLDFSGLKGYKYLDNQGKIKILETGLDVAEFLLQVANVAFVPGEGSFIDPNKMVVRIGVMNKVEELDIGFKRIMSAIALSYEQSRVQEAGSNKQSISSKLLAQYRNNIKLSAKHHKLSPTLEYLARVNSYKEFNNNVDDPERKIIDWTVAKPLPALELPLNIKDALTTNIFTEKDLNEYPDFDPELRGMISKYFGGCDIQVYEDNIHITPTIFDIIDKVLDSNIFNKLNKRKFNGNNNSVLIPTPTFGYYQKQCMDRDIPTHFIEAESENGWKITPEKLKKILAENRDIRLFIFNNPVNPTGVTYTEQEVRSLAQVFAQYPKVNIISDEIFREVKLSEQTPFSIGAVKEIKDQVITVNGVGKSMGLTGVRCSFAHIPPKIDDRLSHGLSCVVTAYSQNIAKQALADFLHNPNCLAGNIEVCKDRIAFIKDKVKQINMSLNNKFNNGNDDKVKYIKPVVSNPDSTTVYLLDFSAFKGFSYRDQEGSMSILNTGLDVAKFLLDNAGVAFVPGEGSFIDAEKMVVRMGVMHSKEELEKSFNKISSALHGLSIFTEKTQDFGGNKAAKVLMERGKKEPPTKKESTIWTKTVNNNTTKNQGRKI